MIRKSIIFTDVPLLKAFLYRERFQLVPFFYFKERHYQSLPGIFLLYWNMSAKIKRRCCRWRLNC